MLIAHRNVAAVRCLLSRCSQQQTVRTDICIDYAGKCMCHTSLHQQQGTSGQQYQTLPAGEAALADFWRVRPACDVKLTVATCRSSDMMRLASSGPLTASSRSLAVSAAVLNLEYLDSSSCACKIAIQACCLQEYSSRMCQQQHKYLSVHTQP